MPLGAEAGQYFQAGQQAGDRFGPAANSLQTLLQMMYQNKQQQDKFNQAVAIQKMKGQQMQDIWGQRAQSAQDIAAMKTQAAGNLAGAKQMAAWNKPWTPSQVASQRKTLGEQHKIAKWIPWSDTAQELRGSKPMPLFVGGPTQGAVEINNINKFVEAARAQGYSEADIQSHIKQKVGGMATVPSAAGADTSATDYLAQSSFLGDTDAEQQLQ